MSVEKKCMNAPVHPCTCGGREERVRIESPFFIGTDFYQLWGLTRARLGTKKVEKSGWKIWKCQEFFVNL